jgi:hypothetical protein
MDMLPVALAVACDTRDNPARARRLLAGLDRRDLEEVARLLAERLPLDVPMSQLGRRAA